MAHVDGNKLEEAKKQVAFKALAQTEYSFEPTSELNTGIIAVKSLCEVLCHLYQGKSKSN